MKGVCRIGKKSQHEILLKSETGVHLSVIYGAVNLIFLQPLGKRQCQSLLKVDVSGIGLLHRETFII